jgi:hypothetical protein
LRLEGREFDCFASTTVILVVAGVGQTIMLTMMFSISIYPKIKTPANLWQVKARAALYTLMMVVFALALPIASLALALQNKDTESNTFLWLVVCLINTVYINYVMLKSIVLKLTNNIHSPKYPAVVKDAVVGMPSLVIEGDPNRKLYLR